MHELAVAIAATGRSVEMRGGVDRSVLTMIAEAASGPMPELPEDHRPATERDVVIISEGQPAITFARVALSPARLIMMVLAPSGLLGWPFVKTWSVPDPLQVELDSVARPEHFDAMAAMGFELWTNSLAIFEHIEEAAVPAAYVGCGSPNAFPSPHPKRYDVVTLASNRWSPLARAAAARLPSSVSYHEIPASSNQEVLRTLGEARIFIHPLRVEGHSRVGREARAMGAVPVVLNTSPVDVGLNEQTGAVVVSTVEEIPAAVMALLKDPSRLAALRQRGMESARGEMDWRRFVDRVDSALSRPARQDHARAARAGMGDAIAAYEDQLSGELSAQVTELRKYAQSLEGEAMTLHRLYDAMTADRDLVSGQLQEMRETRAWRVAGGYWRLRDRFRRRA